MDYPVRGIVEPSAVFAYPVVGVLSPDESKAPFQLFLFVYKHLAAPVFDVLPDITRGGVSVDPLVGIAIGSHKAAGTFVEWHHLVEFFKSGWSYGYIHNYSVWGSPQITRINTD